MTKSRKTSSIMAASLVLILGSAVVHAENACLTGFGGFTFSWTWINLRRSLDSIDYKVILNLSTLSGPLSLWNAKQVFGNTGTVTLATCPTSAAPGLPAAAKDEAGNTQR